MKTPVELRPMTRADYAAWSSVLIPDYAAEKVANGSWPRRGARAQARASLAQLLPLGLGTPGHHLLTLRRGRTVLGYVWLGPRERDAYLYDLYIRPAHRRQGHGRTAMRLVEAEARRFGFTAIGLHVFGRNAPARDLYLSEGYAITDLNMRKVLDA